MFDPQKTVHLSDYQPFSHVLDSVDLTFRLAPEATRVLARLAFRRNPAHPLQLPLWLDGEGLKHLSCRMDGVAVAPGSLTTACRSRRNFCPTVPSSWKPRSRSTRRPIPRWRGFTCPGACTAPSARPKGFARSPITPTAPT